MKRVCTALILALAATPAPAWGCTSAVVSPPASADGRALLWKHRDSKNQHNEVVVRDDGKYLYTGVVNVGDEAAREIWMGVNEAGLAVMNTASDDLGQPDEPKDGEGRLLKVILQSCAGLADVEALLVLTDVGGRDVTTNIGVIDAHGGAAFFEVGQKHHARYDADATQRGYVLRTNFALTAKDEEEGGGHRALPTLPARPMPNWTRNPSVVTSRPGMFELRSSRR